MNAIFYFIREFFARRPDLRDRPPVEREVAFPRYIEARRAVKFDPDNPEKQEAYRLAEWDYERAQS